MGDSDLKKRNDHFVIENVVPSVNGGAWPAKALAGVPVIVEADVFRCGHEHVKAAVIWKKEGATKFNETPMTHVSNDRWRGEFVPGDIGRHEFGVRAWTDYVGTWEEDVRKKKLAKLDVSVEEIEGNELKKNAHLRSDVQEVTFRLTVDRPRAGFGSWYETFIRSMSEQPGKPATFREALWRLPKIKDMGFDVVYLAPIHPIGITGRKGPNNQLKAGPSDPGCPWAIGNEHGGHTAIDPALGTMKDFEMFCERAKELNLEVALDFAVQCSPDHPWVKQHPEWFFHRPDGSIKCAENPPMKYEDICQINFDCENWEELYEELKEVVLFWVKKGIRIFRVDNPHTKPTSFWDWLISSIQDKYPDVIFLAEALTRPKPMKALSKAGFTQSYTYFIWKNSKHELMEYLNEMTTSDMKYHYRPNFFITTQDNIHEYLQKGGRSAFRIRLTLAATLSPSYGIYSGYELCENEAIPGTEEYKDSEKFEIPTRDWNKAGNIIADIKKINGIRNKNAALQEFSNLSFLDIENEHMIAYVKATRDLSNIIISVVNLDPFQKQSGNVRVPLDKIGIAWGERFEVEDLFTGHRYPWGEHNFVELDPHREPMHLLKVIRGAS